MLKFLVAEHAVSEKLARGMLNWRHSGFSVHNQVRVPAEGAGGPAHMSMPLTYHPLPDIA